MRLATSALVPSQVPEFVRSDYPTFVAFVEAYYEYLDGQGVDLLTVVDLDKTLDSFIEYFKQELAVSFPKEIQVNERFLLQHIKDQYLAKGSEGSFKLLFRLLYNKNVEVGYPGKQLLRASDGRWNQDISLFIRVDLGTPDMIDGKLVDVVQPNRTFKVLVDRRQYVEIEVDRVVQLSDSVFEIFIDRKFFGNIQVGDQIRYKEVFSGTIVSTTSSLTVVNGGTGFRLGQLFELKNGGGVRSIMKVTRVNQDGAILSAEFIKYGINYGTDFDIEINPLLDYYSPITGERSTANAVPGGLSITDVMNGFSEQGYVNIDNYARTDSDNYADGTYAGQILREFSAQPLGGITVTNLNLPATIHIKLGSLAKYPGYYSSNDGFISDAIFIQDSRYYQAFSYVLRIDERLATYRTAVRTMVHPAGTALFGEFLIQNNFDISVTLESLIKILAVTVSDTITMVDVTRPIFDVSKPLYDYPVMSESHTFSMIKALADEPLVTEQINFFVSKPLTDSITTPEDAISAKDFGKALADTTVGDLVDSITAKDIEKALTDSTTPIDSLALRTDKYISNELGYPENVTVSSTDDGYVAMNPYSQGGYFSIHPIIYDNTVESTFGSTVDTNNYT
jgi:hypothetical protein